MPIISDILICGAIFVVTVLSMWLAAKALKFKKQGIKPAVFFALVYLAVIFIPTSLVNLILSDTMSETNFMILGYVLWAVIVLAWVLSIKFLYKEGWLKTIAALIIILVIISALSWVLIGPFYRMGAYNL